MLITSGFNFEGYRITQYNGIISGESALGTGFLSSFEAGLADLFGENSSMYANKLDEAKNIAMESLISEAEKRDANAIIGVDLNYTAFSSDIVGVVATGTAVLVEQDKVQVTDTKILEFPVINYYEDSKIRPFQISYNTGKSSICMYLCNFVRSNIKALNVDIKFNTIFGTSYNYSDINFTSIQKKAGLCFTEYVSLSIPLNQRKVIESATVQINHYLNDDGCVSLGSNYLVSQASIEEINKLRIENGNEAMCDFVIGNDDWICICGKKNAVSQRQCQCCGREKGIYGKMVSGEVKSLKDIIVSFENCKCVKDIFDYVEENSILLPDELHRKLKDYITLEKCYGNMKDSCIKELKKLVE